MEQLKQILQLYADGIGIREIARRIRVSSVFAGWVKMQEYIQPIYKTRGKSSVFAHFDI